MTTENLFVFDLQRFDTSAPVISSNSDGEITVDGKADEVGTEGVAQLDLSLATSEDDSVTIDEVAYSYNPTNQNWVANAEIDEYEAGDAATVGGAAYTYSVVDDEGTWTASDATTLTPYKSGDQYTPSSDEDGDTYTYDGTQYWVASAEAEVDLDAPAAGSTLTNDDTEYSYDSDAGWYSTIAASASDYVANGNVYTHEGSSYTYDSTAEAWVANDASTVTYAEGDEVTANDVEYTYTSDEEWSKAATLPTSYADGDKYTTADNAEYTYSTTLGGWRSSATAELDTTTTITVSGTTYTWSEDNNAWGTTTTDAEGEETFTEYDFKDGDTVTQGSNNYVAVVEGGSTVFNAYTTGTDLPVAAADGATVEIIASDDTYTYDGSSWTTTAEETDVLVSGATITKDGVTYTYTAGDDTKTDGWYTSLANLDDAAAGDTVETSDSSTTYAYVGSDWHETLDTDELSDGATYTANGTTYLYNGDEDQWNAAIENITPSANDELTRTSGEDELTYVYGSDSWYQTLEDDAFSDALEAAGTGSLTHDGNTYTYNYDSDEETGNWQISQTTDDLNTVIGAATGDTLEAIEATINGVDYSYNEDLGGIYTEEAPSWSYVQFGDTGLELANAVNATVDTDSATADAFTFESDTKASPAWIYGNDDDAEYTPDSLVLEGVGTLESGLASTQGIQVTADAMGDVALTGVSASDADTPLELTLEGTTLQQTINGAVIDAAFAGAAGENNVSLSGAAGSDGVTIGADTDVTLTSIDENQTWNTSASVTDKNSAVFNNDGNEITVTGGDDNTLAIVGSEVDVNGTTTFAFNGIESINVNGNVDLTSDDDSATSQNAVITAQADAAAVTVNGSTGGSVQLADEGTATVASGVITGVEGLSGDWVLGDEVTSAAVGETSLTFENGGATVTGANDEISKVAFNDGGATVNGSIDDVDINGRTWATENVSAVAFDSDGGIKDLDSDDNSAFTAITLSSGEDAAVLDNAATLKADGAIGYKGTIAYVANSFASGEVTATQLVIGDVTDGNTADITSETGLGIKFDKANSVSFADGAITEFGNEAAATLAFADSESVAVGSWTKIVDSDKLVEFDAAGNLTVDQEAAEVEGIGTVTASGAAISNSTFNSISVNVTDDTSFNVVLDAGGISEINSVVAGAQVEVGSGDGAFTFNDGAFTIGGDGKGYTLSEDSDGNLAVYTDKNAGRTLEAYGSSQVTFYIDSDANTASSADVLSNDTVATYSGSANGVGYTIKAADFDESRLVFADGTSDLTTVYLGAAADGITVTTSEDKEFDVVANVNPQDSDSISVININGVNVSLDAAHIPDGTTQVTIHADTSDSSNPVFTISTLDEDAEMTVESAGTYGINNNTTVASDVPAIVFDDDGTTKVIPTNLADAQNSLNDMLDHIVDVANATQLPAIEQFQAAEVETESGTTTYSDLDSNMIAYSKAIDDYAASSSTTVAGAEINIIADDVFCGTKVTSVTLNSSSAFPIYINSVDDVVDSNEYLKNLTVNLSGDATLAAVNNVAQDVVLTAGSNQSTLYFGAGATGANRAQAGSGGALLVNRAGGVDEYQATSLIGGAGADTIYTNHDGDYVSGGTGADRFYDAANYTISDYSAGEGDVIVGTGLGTIGAYYGNLTLGDGSIKIADGDTVNIGTGGGAGANRAIVESIVDGGQRQVAWTGSEGGTINLSGISSINGALIIANQNGNVGDFIDGSDGNDTIYAGANDSVSSSDGDDLIVLQRAEDYKYGAMVALNLGKNTVHGWREGFNTYNDYTTEDNNGGADILWANAEDLAFGAVNDGVEEVRVYSKSTKSSLVFADTDSSTKRLDLLVGTSLDNTKRVTFVKSAVTATQAAAENDLVIVKDDEQIADYYISNSKFATVQFSSDVTVLEQATLDSTAFQNIHALNLYNEGTGTLFGSARSDTVGLAGSAANEAEKKVSLGGGNDIVYSNYDGTDSLAGHEIWFGNRAGGHDGADSIYSFKYENSTVDDPNRVSADIIVLNSFSKINANDKGITFFTAHEDGDESITIVDNSITGTNQQKVFARILKDDGTSEDFHVAVGRTDTINNFTYDADVTHYYGNADRGQDTITVGSDETNVSILLEGSVLQHGDGEAYYEGISVIDASAVTVNGANLTLSGGSANNLIVGGGEGANSSLWGGGEGSYNTLIGGNGRDIFFHIKGYRENDTIQGLNDDEGDMIYLQGITLDDLKAFSIDAENKTVTVAFKSDEGDDSITVTNAKSDKVQFLMGDGYTHVADLSTGQWSDNRG